LRRYLTGTSIDNVTAWDLHRPAYLMLPFCPNADASYFSVLFHRRQLAHARKYRRCLNLASRSPAQCLCSAVGGTHSQSAPARAFFCHPQLQPQSDPPALTSPRSASYACSSRLLFSERFYCCSASRSLLVSPVVETPRLPPDQVEVDAPSPHGTLFDNTSSA
jgi:hypothetical protein